VIFLANGKNKFEKDKEMAQYFDTMALTYKQVGNLSKSKEYTLKQLNITEQIYPNHFRLATSYTNYSSLLQEMGELSLAKEYAIKGLDIYIKQKADNTSMALAIAHNNLGLIYRGLKQYSNAKEYFDKALKSFEKTNQVFNMATTYYNLALVEKDLNNLEDSKKYVIKSIKLFEQVETKFGKFEYKKLENHSSQKDIADYVNYYVELQKEGISTVLPTKTTLGKARNLLATLINPKTVENNSIDMIEQTITENILFLGEKHPQMAEYYNDLAMLYMRKGDLKEAKYQIEKSIYIGQESFSKNNLTYMTYLSNYSLILLDMFNKGLSNNMEEAFLFKRKSFAIFKKNTYENFISLSEEEQIIYLDSDKNEQLQSWIKMAYLFMTNQYERQFSLDNSEKDKILEAKMKKLEVVKIMANDWINYKSRIFDNANILSKIKSKMLDKNIKYDIDTFRTLTKKLAHLYQQSFTTDELKLQNKKQIEICKEDRKNIEIKLRKESKFFDKLTDNSINYMDISQQLTRNELYIDYLKFEDMYFMLMIRDSGSLGIVHISASETKDINRYIKELKSNNQKMVQVIRSKTLNGTQKQLKEQQLKKESQILLSKLYDTLISRYLSTQLQGTSKLIISPDGFLNFLPFEALYHNGKYLIEDYKISYISSGREFVRQTKREPYVLANRKMICFGNPDFNTSLPISQIKGRFGGTNQVVEETWEQFKYFRPIGNAEIITIRNLYKNALIYEDKKATVENLMKVDGSQILHLSTHGKFLDSKSIENPMLKAGLAFSGANDRTTLSGIVTALKISALDLQDTELVVLSACESGLGEVQNAEGVMGLPKAFLQAGARNVMMSLWSVSTQKTAMLMKSFYKNVQNGQDYETALRNAKLEMIEMHPYYWSAFVMHGIQN
jgi:CHAT domain-containing protein/Tfp pilus assembly protein PilF